MAGVVGMFRNIVGKCGVQYENDLLSIYNADDTRLQLNTKAVLARKECKRQTISTIASCNAEGLYCIIK